MNSRCMDRWIDEHAADEMYLIAAAAFDEMYIYACVICIYAIHVCLFIDQWSMHRWIDMHAGDDMYFYIYTT